MQDLPEDNRKVKTLTKSRYTQSNTIGLYRQTIKDEIGLTLKFAMEGVGGRPKVDLVVTKECSSFLGAAVYVWQQYDGAAAK